MHSRILFLTLIGLATLAPTPTCANELKKLDRLNTSLISGKAAEFCQQTMRFQSDDLANSCCALSNTCGGKFVDNGQCQAQKQQCQIAQLQAPTMSQALTTFSTRSSTAIRKLALKIKKFKKHATGAVAKKKLGKLKATLKALRLRNFSIIATGQRIIQDGIVQQNFICKLAPACEGRPEPSPTPVRVESPAPSATPETPCSLDSDGCRIPPYPVVTPCQDANHNFIECAPVEQPSPSPTSSNVESPTTSPTPEDPCTLYSDACRIPPQRYPAVTPCQDANHNFIECGAETPTPVDPCVLNPRTCSAPPRPLPADYVCPDANGDLVPCDTLPCDGNTVGCTEILPEPLPIQRLCLDENNEPVPCP